MSLRSPVTALTGLALALSSGPPPAPKPPAAPSSPPSPARAAPARAGDPKARAIQAARGGDLAEAARLIEQVLATSPEDRQALLLLAEITTQQASRLERPENTTLWLKAVGIMRRLVASHEDLTPAERLLLGVVLYNEACVFAVEGQVDKALGALAEAVASGFDQVEVLESDRDLDSLRASPRFLELKEKVEDGARIHARERAKSLLAISKPYPFDFKLPDLGGKTVSRADFKGKVAIVNVWGTWCPPCRRLVPRLVRLLEEEGKRGLEVVGINYERVAAREVKETVKAFVAKNKVPYPCLLGDEETRKRIPQFGGFPTTLFLDRAGMVRLTVQGELSRLNLDAIASLLLAEGASESAVPRRPPPAGPPVDAGTPPPRP